ncbi:unnamed protein product [Blepharisma stoltei]|uniref:Maturase K n=1 Tax=Blepharisma stoltei TaxID=1481888 RepID=A0AAU9KDR5_9CILI|nr:unnamed protein product [Blepharisma stoltei]
MSYFKQISFKIYKFHHFLRFIFIWFSNINCHIILMSKSQKKKLLEEVTQIHLLRSFDVFTSKKSLPNV